MQQDERASVLSTRTADDCDCSRCSKYVYCEHSCSHTDGRGRCRDGTPPHYTCTRTRTRTRTPAAAAVQGRGQSSRFGEPPDRTARRWEGASPPCYLGSSGALTPALGRHDANEPLQHSSMAGRNFLPVTFCTAHARTRQTRRSVERGAEVQVLSAQVHTVNAVATNRPFA
jgi:hypothetical protein